MLIPFFRKFAVNAADVRVVEVCSGKGFSTVFFCTGDNHSKKSLLLYIVPVYIYFLVAHAFCLRYRVSYPCE